MVASAAVLSATKISPNPTPCQICGTRIEAALVWSERWDSW